MNSHYKDMTVTRLFPYLEKLSLYWDGAQVVHYKSMYPSCHITGLVVNYGISNTYVLEIPYFTTKPLTWATEHDISWAIRDIPQTPIPILVISWLIGHPIKQAMWAGEVQKISHTTSPIVSTLQVA